MTTDQPSVVLVHVAWADGSSWSKVTHSLQGNGIKAVAAPLPLTSLANDVAALEQTLERIDGPVVLAGHAYAGAVIGETRNAKVRSLVYIAALAPDEGETVADVSARVDAFLAEVHASPATVGIVFAHGHLLRIFAARAIGQPGELGRHLGLDTASVSIIDDLRDGAAITLWNDVGHGGG